MNTDARFDQLCVGVKPLISLQTHSQVNVGLYEEYEAEDGSSGHENGSEVMGSLVAATRCKGLGLSL